MTPGRRARPPLAGGSGSSASSGIAAWVAATFIAQTIDGVTIYDLTTPAG